MIILTNGIQFDSLGIMILIFGLIIIGLKTKIPIYNLLAGAASLYAAYVFSDEMFLLIIFIALALIQFSTAYLGVKS